jgi:putative transposase
MARPLRIQYPGAFYHVTAKGSEGKRIFLTSADYGKFKELLLEGQQKFHVAVHGYLLLGNEYQLILETREANLSRFMHHLAGCYTTYFNNRRKTTGHLFQGRYKAILIEEKGLLLELSRYMHLNPVRARIVKKPEEYIHSSYRAYVLKEREELVFTDLVLRAMSTDTRRARQKYREFIKSGMAKQLTNPLQEVYGQAIAGSPSFVKKVAARIDKKQTLAKGPSRRTTIQRASDVERILTALSSHFKVPRKVLLADRSTYRNVAIYFTKKYTGLTNSEIGERFGNITYSAVTRAATRVVERARKEKELQGHLNELEKKLALVKA